MERPNEPIYELRLNFEIVSPGQGNGLRVSEYFQIRAGNFLEVAKILGQFHDLAKKIEEENK